MRVSPRILDVWVEFEVNLGEILYSLRKLDASNLSHIRINSAFYYLMLW